MSSSPASVLIVTLELGRVNRSVCGCNPNLSSPVHPTGNCRDQSLSIRALGQIGRPDSQRCGHTSGTSRCLSPRHRRLFGIEESVSEILFIQAAVASGPQGLMPPTTRTVWTFWKYMMAAASRMTPCFELEFQSLIWTFRQRARILSEEEKKLVIPRTEKRVPWLHRPYSYYLFPARHLNGRRPENSARNPPEWF